MGKIMKPGKVVLVLNGRYAGKKAVIIKQQDDGKPHSQALIAGIARYPRKIISRLSKKKMERRCKIKAFVKMVNYNHLMPTRYSVDVSFDTKKVNRDSLSDPSKKFKARLEVKQKLEERFKQGLNRWFFQKLRF
ncbi:60S ribosomal protein L27-like [Tropilaelaps mercedesae]|uniref:Large ribosomal subunit protein eL27 n=1 Tax=Tropilaelaps mercedesae TaxID=418985 RepID=A0A1V9XDM5_9ACAR|nr:60S ribosomal protein L27-like [Tropilaelaps mercedesae]